MTAPVVLCEVDPRGVATVTLNRPEVNNAYDGAVVQTLSEIFAGLACDVTVRLVVIRGNGRHFQAGADLKWLRAIAEMDQAANLATSRQTAALVRSLNEFGKPTLALIHGACIGGGTGIAAACDIVVATSDAVFAISEARWGMLASIILPQLNAAIGVRQVRRYALTCERFSAQRAYEIGLVHEVCAPGALDATAAPIIEGLLMSGPQAVIGSKRGCLECAGAIIGDDEFERLVAMHADKRQSPEAAEGLLSFLEKRNPSWYPE